MTKEMGLSIISWNINGLRSSKTSIKDLLDGLQADIICLQETKITSKKHPICFLEKQIEAKKNILLTLYSNLIVF